MIPRMNDFGTDWALRSRRVVTPAGVRPATVLVRGEHIAAVLEHGNSQNDVPIEDVGDKYVLPGLVDSHVHINEPGRTDWEGFETATRAAAAGGITTLIDMPLNSSPVTTTVEALNAKREAATAKLFVDCGFHGGVVPGNTKHIQPLVVEGVCGFKAFLCPSGIDEFPNVTEADLREVMPILAAAKIPLLVHAELQRTLPPGLDEWFSNNPSAYMAWLRMRPSEWEFDAIDLLIKLSRETGCHTHIVHLSASLETDDLLRNARSERLPLTVETCPHYLYFASDVIPDRDPRYKCAPPIRSSRHREHLRNLLQTGVIDTIGSDHSPAPPEIKYIQDGDLKRAWGGIASVQLLLPASWTAMHDECIFAALTQRPAELCGVGNRKGAIKAGNDADLIVFDPETQFQVRSANLHHRHKDTPYEGRTLRGMVETTYLRGRKVFHKGELLGQPSGQLLKRGT